MPVPPFRLGLGLVLLVLSAAVACGHRQTSEPEAPQAPPPPPGDSVRPFFPLAVGNSWHYRGEMLGESVDREVRIVGRDGPWYVDSEGERFMLDVEGLRSPVRYLLRAPIRAGESWSSVVSLTHTEHYEIAETGVVATVPAGQFHACVRVLARTRLDPTATLFKADTYCPRVGLVRIQVWVDAAGRGQLQQADLKLHAYQLAGDA